MNNLFITDGQNGNILDHVNKQYVLFNEHEQGLPTNLETFTFTTLGDKRFAAHLGKRNGLIVPGEDGELLEFRIFESLEYRDNEGLKAEVYASASYLDIKKSKVFDPHKTNAETAQKHAEIALAGTGIQIGNIAFKGVRTLEFDGPFNPYDYIKRIAREFELEIKFYVTHDGSKITGRYLDLVDRIGEWRGRTVEFGRDLQRIERNESTNDVVTALWVYGPDREDGTRLKVFVENDEARQRWGVNGKHLVEHYEPQTENQDITDERLRTLGNMELNKRIDAIVTYLANIVDLENVPGLENKKIRFGDTIRIKDLKFNPPLYLEGRIFNQKRDVFVKSNKRVELGDYIEYTEDEVKAIWKTLQEQIRKKISLAEMREYAEAKKIMSDTPPAEQTENVTWVDTSQEPYVPKVYNFGEWQKLSPTTASEVDAYTRLETNDISKDATRLEVGIIDVGAVPLRTSVTGARIEWDGINGLVQYDKSGEVTSWMDLDGNAHFENGYFQGEVHAEIGTFSGTVQGAEILGSTLRSDDPDSGAYTIINSSTIESYGIGEFSGIDGDVWYKSYFGHDQISMVNETQGGFASLGPNVLYLERGSGEYTHLTSSGIFSNGKITLYKSGSTLELNAQGSTATGYIEFTDTVNGRRGYFGFGSTSNKELTLLSQTGQDIVLNAGSASVRSLNPVILTNGMQIKRTSTDASRWEFNHLANGLEIRARGTGWGNVGTLFLNNPGAMTQVEGNFLVRGTKSALVETENYGERLMYALETPDNRFVSYTEHVLEEGEHVIEIEPMFRETISNYFVVPHIQNSAEVTILERRQNNFRVWVHGHTAEVVFEVNGKRKGFEDKYMEEILPQMDREDDLNETSRV